MAHKSSEYHALFRMTNPAQELVLDRVEGNRWGMHHVRLAQQVDGRPGFGGQLIVHLMLDNQIVAVNGKFAPEAKVPAKPALTIAQAYARARQELSITTDLDAGKSSAAAGGPGLSRSEFDAPGRPVTGPADRRSRVSALSSVLASFLTRGRRSSTGP